MSLQYFNMPSVSKDGLENLGVLLSFRAESFLFQVAIQKIKDQDL